VRLCSSALAFTVGVIGLIACLSGCDQVEQETVVSDKSVSGKILRLEDGASIDVVRNQLGEPVAQTSQGAIDALSYGIWQLTFTNGRLTMRSKVILPRDGLPSKRSGGLNREIRRLRLGTSLGMAEARLGTPEVVYVIYEDGPQPVKILRYAPWELTFVNGKLSQRSQ